MPPLINVSGLADQANSQFVGYTGDSLADDPQTGIRDDDISRRIVGKAEKRGAEAPKEGLKNAHSATEQIKSDSKNIVDSSDENQVKKEKEELARHGSFGDSLLASYLKNQGLLNTDLGRNYAQGFPHEQADFRNALDTLKLSKVVDYLNGKRNWRGAGKYIQMKHENIDKQIDSPEHRQQLMNEQLSSQNRLRAIQRQHDVLDNALKLRQLNDQSNLNLSAATAADRLGLSQAMQNNLFGAYKDANAYDYQTALKQADYDVNLASKIIDNQFQRDILGLDLKRQEDVTKLNGFVAQKINAHTKLVDQSINAGISELINDTNLPPEVATNFGQRTNVTALDSLAKYNLNTSSAAMKRIASGDVEGGYNILANANLVNSDVSLMEEMTSQDSWTDKGGAWQMLKSWKKRNFANRHAKQFEKLSGNSAVPYLNAEGWANYYK